MIIPNGVTSIGENAFLGCNSLTKVTIPDSVTNIGDWAFDGCSGLTSMKISANVINIGKNPFSGCSLKDIDISSDNPAYTAIDGILFDKQQEMLLTYPSARKGKYEIPQGTLFIGAGAFADCIDLSGVVIPDSVTSIGSHAFYGSNSLISMTIPDSVISIGEWAFFGCSGLSSITIPDSITSISDLMFANCSGLSNMMIPDSITSIGNRAFGRCNGLTSVIIPDSVISIGEYAFDSCPNLTLTVARCSAAEQYAKENNIPYVLATKEADTQDPPAADETSVAAAEQESPDSGSIPQDSSIIGTIKITGGANIRSNPGTGDNAKVIDKVAEGERFDALSQDAATGWYQFIWKDGQEVWISSKMVEFTPSGN